MGRSVRKYFWADSSKHPLTIAASLILILFLNTLIIALPGISQFSESPLSIIIIIVSLIIPALFGTILIPNVKLFFESSSTLGKIFLSVHGLIFAGVIQMLVYLQVSDFLLSQMFTGTHFGLQVIMIVAAGIYTLVGGLNAVLYANLIISVFVIGSTLFVALNTVMVQNFTLFSFHSAIRTGTEVFAANGSSEPNALITGIGIACMMLWIIWIELGMIHKQSVAKTDGESSVSALVAGVVAALIITAVLIAYRQTPQAAVTFSQNADIANSIIAVSLLSGMIGLFALSFQSVSSIIAIHVYPVIKHRYSGEEQVLIGRLSTVVFSFFSILLLSFAKLSGNIVIYWYTEFLAFFTMPIVAVFLISLVTKKGISGSLLVGLALGEIYALVEFIIKGNGSDRSFFNSTSSYSFAIEIMLVTLLLGYSVVRFGESGIGQKFLLRIGVSRPVS
ncbi:MAG: hypothetical protein HYV29_14300 [Ignavibacteriales bacterium]|nr:hypothetical protein [Ignavibacteriales bacterium]